MTDYGLRNNRLTKCGSTDRQTTDQQIDTMLNQRHSLSCSCKLLLASVYSWVGFLDPGRSILGVFIPGFFAATLGSAWGMWQGHSPIDNPAEFSAAIANLTLAAFFGVSAPVVLLGVLVNACRIPCLELEAAYFNETLPRRCREVAAAELTARAEQRGALEWAQIWRQRQAALSAPLEAASKRER